MAPKERPEGFPYDGVDWDKDLERLIAAEERFTFARICAELGHVSLVGREEPLKRRGGGVPARYDQFLLELGDVA
ncbi:hypothetical protein CSA80_00250 [Candidatus Saccharibacteria bacterium]|nr:MAG: hypothetical protein CR973_00590 [Candidatus Saccharibacteria bacterium]PID99640.1 MAG: hypothetical protein CSA80_00250 [Candidatus Saccharibacteria bacterium]